MTMSVSQLVAALALALLSSTVSAQVSPFVGTWKNIDPNTRSLASLQVDLKGADLRVQAWGKCSPTDCPWGETDGTSYEPDIKASLPQTVRVILARFTSKVSETLLIVHAAENNRLEVDVLRRYTDNSGRSNTSQVAVLGRASLTSTR